MILNVEKEEYKAASRGVQPLVKTRPHHVSRLRCGPHTRYLHLKFNDNKCYL